MHLLDQICMVEEFLYALNDIDQRQILTVFCFYPSQPGDSTTQPVTSNRPQRPRMMSLTSRLDMSWFIKREWGAEAGNMLVAGKVSGALIAHVTDNDSVWKPKF